MQLQKGNENNFELALLKELKPMSLTPSQEKIFLVPLHRIYKLESAIRGKPPTIRLEHWQKYSQEIAEEMFKDFKSNRKRLGKVF